VGLYGIPNKNNTKIPTKCALAGIFVFVEGEQNIYNIPENTSVVKK
jgi:hypothetical protein